MRPSVRARRHVLRASLRTLLTHLPVSTSNECEQSNHWNRDLLAWSPKHNEKGRGEPNWGIIARRKQYLPSPFCKEPSICWMAVCSHLSISFCFHILADAELHRQPPYHPLLPAISWNRISMSRNQPRQTLRLMSFHGCNAAISNSSPWSKMLIQNPIVNNVSRFMLESGPNFFPSFFNTLIIYIYIVSLAWLESCSCQRERA